MKLRVYSIQIKIRYTGTVYIRIIRYSIYSNTVPGIPGNIDYAYTLYTLTVFLYGNRIGIPVILHYTKELRVGSTSATVRAYDDINIQAYLTGMTYTGTTVEPTVALPVPAW